MSETSDAIVGMVMIGTTYGLRFDGLESVLLELLVSSMREGAGFDAVKPSSPSSGFRVVVAVDAAFYIQENTTRRNGSVAMTYAGYTVTIWQYGGFPLRIRRSRIGVARTTDSIFHARRRRR